MHFVLTALGSYGDVHPMIGLGVALRERGHEVDLISNPYFREEVEGAGLRLTPVTTEEDYLRLTHHPDLWSPVKSGGVILREAALGHIEALYDRISERARPGQSTLVAHGLDLASRVARESLGVPVAGVMHAPMALFCDRQPPKSPIGWIRPGVPPWLIRLQFGAIDRLYLRRAVWPTINRLRARGGLGKLRGNVMSWVYDVDLTLCLFPEWFAPTAPGWPKNTICAGFPLWDGARHRLLSDACRAFLDAGEPPIVFTPGSANRHSAQYLAQSVRICERLNRRGVLLTKFDEQVPPDLPASVARFAFEPLTRLLPRAAAFVHHGGIGSSSQALAAGAPQLIRPQAFDQLDNAMRLTQLGVARELCEKQFNEQTAIEEIDALLTSQEVAVACREAAAKCDSAESMRRACESLESIAPKNS